MRIHLLGMPHTQTTEAYSWCAYTQKIRKLANMLTAEGHEVLLYAGEENEAHVAELIPVVTKAEQEGWYGKYDWERDTFGEFDAGSPGWVTMNNRAIAQIRQRKEPWDVLGLTMGLSQKPVADALLDLLHVEVGIGYTGVFAPHRVYESYAWMHYLAAFTGADDVRAFDAVIPNSFEPDNFPLGEGSGGYYLFLGRFIRRKGIQIAVETTQRIGAELVMAGQGVVKVDHGGKRFSGIDVTVEGKHLTHVGTVNPKQRATLMGNATAVFVPSIYLEPFAGVAVEAMMCGTPVITTDHGAFTETVLEGVTGFRCGVLSDFICAAEDVKALDRAQIREITLGRYSVDVVRKQYHAYLERLATLQGDGWYTMKQKPGVLA